MDKIIAFLLIIVTASSCYRNNADGHDALAIQDSICMNDSVSFYTTHHYTVGYNFIVRGDSLCLIAQQPEEHVSQLVTDTFSIKHNMHVAVSDIRIVPQDSIDSVWVQLISEEGLIGWSHETEMLQHVMPTDPISQFIMMFSDSHIIIALIILVLIAVAYIVRTIQKRNAPIVHFRDIPSMYPTLLCIIVACSAALYASLQMFGANTWQHFYYHPSLNPFSMPFILGIFISSVWAMLITGIAAVEDTCHNLELGDAVLYLMGLSGVCAVLYIVFSISTLYYIGYPLLIAYCCFAIYRYTHCSRMKYVCGNCGKKMKHKGVCPHCSAVNE